MLNTKMAVLPAEHARGGRRGTSGARAAQWRHSARRVVMLGALSLLGITQAHAADQVQLLLDWLPGGEFAAYFAGVSKGFWKDQGIDLTIGRGYGGGDTVTKVAANVAPFGIADSAPVLTAAAKTGAKIEVISSMYTFSPHAIFVLESSHIDSFKDLAGKRIGITPGNSHAFYFPEVAKRSGLDPASVNWVSVDASSLVPLLVSKKLDAIPQFFIDQYQIAQAASAQGEKIRVLTYASAGFKIYSSVIFANDEVVAKNPDLVRRFLSGLWTSVKWAHEHPDDACQLHVGANPGQKIEACLAALKRVDALVFSDSSKKFGYGRFDTSQLADTWSEISKAQHLDSAWNPSTVIDLQYLPKGNDK